MLESENVLTNIDVIMWCVWIAQYNFHSVLQRDFVKLYLVTRKSLKCYVAMYFVCNAVLSF